ncbi:MORN repeat-containing protein [Besnoitia besnoiti]|uniref:MORN repeat-containing protein n=1 Tax=Besnoitia besnoiti TaxID=94643 RepID=A0A2A9MQG9_BESBE|nr:MORN repeat-containing protein [Besnoitia besnoiti]PFH38503.1 MORN repeat-containing protein [Besnoitia besnoiti]
MTETVVRCRELSKSGDYTTISAETLPTHVLPFPDGGKYIGEYKVFETGQRAYHGKGSYKNGGYKCIGEWREGQFVRGTIHFPTGDIYEGQVDNGAFHGWGRYTWADGEQFYEGAWDGGLMDGWGTLRVRTTSREGLIPGDDQKHSNSSSSPYRDVAGFFCRGSFHQAPKFQLIAQDEFSKRYVAQWCDAALNALRDLDAALQQGMDISCYLAATAVGATGCTVNSLSGASSKGPARVSAEGSFSTETDSRGRSQKKVSTRATAKGLPGKQGSSSSAGHDLKHHYSGNPGEYGADKFVLPPYPLAADLHTEGISRLVNHVRGELGTPAGLYEVQVPLAEADLYQLVTVDPVRVSSQGRKFGAGSGQIVELTVHLDGSSSLVASIALVNCNDMMSSTTAARFRVVGLSLPSPQQLRRLK